MKAMTVSNQMPKVIRLKKINKKMMLKRVKTMTARQVPMQKKAKKMQLAKMNLTKLTVKLEVKMLQVRMAAKKSENSCCYVPPTRTVS